jgi:hypothetical protein
VAGSGFDLAGLAGTTADLVVRPDPATAAAVAAGLLALVVLAAVAAGTSRPDRTDRAEPEAR